MTSSARLTVLSVAVAIGAIAAYALLLRVPLVRNHPEGYVLALAVATALAVVAVRRARGRRWPAWLALGLSGFLLRPDPGEVLRAVRAVQVARDPGEKVQ